MSMQHLVFKLVVVDQDVEDSIFNLCFVIFLVLTHVAITIMQIGDKIGKFRAERMFP
jgi:hypothetical protein